MTDIVIGQVASDEATVRSAATGDHIAFARLVATHHRSMARAAFVVCGDDATAQDAVQSAWSIAWRRLGSLRDPAQIRPWLVAIAANEARQAVRRRRRYDVVDVSEAIDRPDESSGSDRVELVDLARVLRGLKPEDRALLAMRYAAGLESSEIARQLGISSSGARSRLARLLERLRTDLALDTEDAP